MINSGFVAIARLSRYVGAAPPKTHADIYALGLEIGPRHPSTGVLGWRYYACLLSMIEQGFRQCFKYGHSRIKRGVRVLKDHLHLSSPRH